MKIKELQSALRKRKIAGSLFINTSSSSENPHITYFTGYTGVGVLYVPAAKSPSLFVPRMERERAAKGMVKNIRELDKKKLFDCLQNRALRKKAKIGIDPAALSLASYQSMRKNLKKASFANISRELQELRAVKTYKELLIIKKAFWHANRIYEKTLRQFSDFKIETDVAAYMEYESRKLGLELSFPVIIASGKNASMPHHHPQPQKLQRGLCVIDFGIRYKNYCTDMTRTVGIGTLSTKEKNEHASLLRIQKSLAADVHENETGHSLYKKAVWLLGEKSRYFTHGLGHGIGVEIHESPSLSPNSKDIIKNGMVLTIEPGVYLPGKYGIRIEDSIIVSEKARVLTTPSKELMAVK